jgi:hypothetical protein
LELPVEIRCEIYKCLLTADGGASYAMISLSELRYRAKLRKIRDDGGRPPSIEQKRVHAAQHCLLYQDDEATGAVLAYDGEGDPLIHVNILRVSRHVYKEATNIIYENNTFSIDLDAARPNEPFHYQFIASWKLSSIQYLRIVLGAYDDYAFPQSRSYGIWSSFFHLPALRELQIAIILDGTDPQCVKGTWDTSTYCAQTVGNMVAALPEHVRLTPGDESTTAQSKLVAFQDDTGRKHATSNEIKALFELLTTVRAMDVESWATDMGQPLVGPSSSYDGGIRRENNAGQLVIRP